LGLGILSGVTAIYNFRDGTVKGGEKRDLSSFSCIEKRGKRELTVGGGLAKVGR